MCECELGITTALDDFATGYSSLSFLIERPVDVLKIDRSFIAELPSPRSIAIVHAIITMATALGLDAVAEGVDGDRQASTPSELGCSRIQSYLLARPMSLPSLVAYDETLGERTPSATRRP